jgi:Protein of unknown function (DUF3485)
MIKIVSIPFLLCAFLSVIFILPKKGLFAESSIKSKPPLYFGDWDGVESKPSEKELAILAKDTTFIKVAYISYDHPIISDDQRRQFPAVINASIVKSGNDINNSIHRPERCLKAQGHLDLTSISDQLVTPQGKSLRIQTINSKLPSFGTDGKSIPTQLGFISYYYFVGDHQMTNSHFDRTILDIKDRILKGSDQQWSFIMLSIPYNLGANIDEGKHNREIADKKIRELVGEFADRMVKWDEIR